MVTAILGLSLEATLAAARDLVNYQSFDTSVYLQSGNKVDPATTLSPICEAFGDYSLGDLYVYSIWQNSLEADYAGDDSIYYYKLVPRLSFSKLTGYDVSAGPFKDVCFAQWIATTEGMGFDCYPGISLDWQAPWLSWLRTTYYFEHNSVGGWNDQRLHVDFGIPLAMSMGDFRIVGTFDQTVGLVGQARTTDFKPELHYDAGKALGIAPGHLWTGIVINPIRNKYKIADSPQFETNQCSFGVFLRYSFF